TDAPPPVPDAFPSTHPEDEPSFAGDAGGAEPGVNTVQSMAENGTALVTTFQPGQQAIDMAPALAEAASELTTTHQGTYTEGLDAPTANDGDQGGAQGTDNRPYLPDASDLTDALGVDTPNAATAPTASANDFDLPTIADAPAQDAPPVDDIQLPVIPDTPPVDDPAPPPPPADMPDLVLPDIPAAPDAPDLSQIPDLPDLPDPPSQPDPQDFPADDGPSFGDDIGNDVSPSDPTTTDF
ncbi:MAG: hypothetical protein JWN39_2216, partial [Ilumatobacteraceae bacterium]|nr:hypothetical protein [Ilumatobacteraceae bacterium]